MPAEETRFLAPSAWVDGRWLKDVLLTVDGAGLWSGVAPDAPPEARAGALRLPGPVAPGLVNAHSHAFQRAMAGLTERRGTSGQDDFWSWRDRMYSAANRVTPQQLEAIAAQLYTEMLAGGYTHVCEFHYLHNDTSGQDYPDPLEMSLALARAARRAGIGLTLLPTLYMRSGFGAAGLREDQRRFASTPEGILRIAEAINRQAGVDSGTLNAGAAIHSLRAVGQAALSEVAAGMASVGGPVHIHIAEQIQEVKDSITHTGQRPIEWLLAHASPDARWNLVHATHTTPAELRGVQACGAAIVICPTTEANLGDGVFDLPGHGAHGVWSIGSDSHVSRHAMEELRLLEYSQRLTLRQRNVTSHADGRVSTAAALFDGALAGGQAATSLPLGGLAVGRRADFVVVDAGSPALLGVPDDYLMDAMVFSSPAARYAEVYVAGRRVPAPPPRIAADFSRAMNELWA
ncbi:MAG: formimidoylglutamate deiminase [Comamonadaceae bacterium]|nr:MAG: formimidoylglutamate deiminase [Comamonadaceae bacterium]